ncbi:hypothetical protein I3760_12G061200 [Carya illinoinensis]|nr:hypothetical protein I3760_12G061200 [Carya illinoinensis]
MARESAEAEVAFSQPLYPHPIRFLGSHSQPHLSLPAFLRVKSTLYNSLWPPFCPTQPLPSPVSLTPCDSIPLCCSPLNSRFFYSLKAISNSRSTPAYWDPFISLFHGCDCLRRATNSPGIG